MELNERELEMIVFALSMRAIHFRKKAFEEEEFKEFKTYFEIANDYERLKERIEKVLKTTRNNIHV